MHFGTESLTGHHIALSFGVGMFIDSLFMDGFVKCIAEDDLTVRPECFGYRIFLRPLIAVSPFNFQLIMLILFSAYIIDITNLLFYRTFSSQSLLVLTNRILSADHTL